MGAGVAHRGGNCLHHALDIAQHVIVPEPQHTIAARSSSAVRRVARESRGFIVLSAIEFDDKTRGVTGEVREVWTNRCLTAEMGTCDCQVAQMLPKDAFGVGWFVTHLPRAGDARVAFPVGLSLLQDPPPPTPPPRFAGGGGLKRRCVPRSERRDRVNVFCAFLSDVARESPSLPLPARLRRAMRGRYGTARGVSRPPRAYPLAAPHCALRYSASKNP